MNVGIFNRVNHKSIEADGMYSEWSSLPLEGGGQGVLGSVGGRDVVVAVVGQLASPEPSSLQTDADVEWVLEVVRYGLSLPLVEHEALRDCVRVCCSWLSALLPSPPPPSHPPSPAVPPPVAASPHKYARKILKHLHNLFVPRPNENGDLVSKQAVLCHRVLRLSRSLALTAPLGAGEWRALLRLLLAAAGALLAPPAPRLPDLTARVLHVLLEIWLLACHRCFPSPPLWRTLREQCMRWRHRAVLVEQWARVSCCLTARLLQHMYGPWFPLPPLSEEDLNLIPADMSGEAIVQSWYRMLHTIGNPVDLCRPHLVTNTPDFLQYSISDEEGSRDPTQHPSLQSLPGIFLKAMKGISAHVDAFLGVGQEPWWGTTEEHEQVTPPTQRRLAKSFSVSNKTKSELKGVPRSSLIGLNNNRPTSVVPTTPPNSITSQVGDAERPPLTPLRPKVNSIFHLFGEWLFEAALIGTQPTTVIQQRADGTPPPPSLTDLSNKMSMLNYQPGRAEAVGALCRVLCSKQCREEIVAPYLARCYSAIHRALIDPNTAAAVVLNATNIFRLDLDGVLVLVPYYISALERILPEREPKLECGLIDKKELRKAAISTLLSLVAIPHHYRDLPVPEFPGCNEYAGQTMGSLCRGRISLLCVNAVQVEWTESLAVPLLSALYLCVRHNATPSYNITQPDNDYKARSDSSKAISTDGSQSSLEDYSADVFKELDPNSPVFGATLVVRATYLVCHRLISSWKSDLQVSLAALELLAGLAKLHSDKPEALERRRAVRWMCDYISVQCSRPPPAHSRDLHSCVVAAYAALSAWLCPALLAHPPCLRALLEVVELGISGTKSQGKPGETPKMKDEKDLKPVSMRVRDAAESLLMLILEQVGGKTSGVWSRLDERWLAARGHLRPRHFLLDNALLLGLLEEPLANSQEPQPTLIVIIRGGFGRYAWSLCGRGAARSAGRSTGPCTRPIDFSHSSRPMDPQCRPTAHVDAAFPSLDSVLRQLNDPEAPILFKLLEKQAAIEKQVRESEDNATPEEFVPPEPVTEFQTARLFLSQFGYLNISGDKKSTPSRLVSLDSSAEGFEDALRRIDACGARVAVTAHVFYVRSGQVTAADVVRNANDINTLPSAFIRMLKGLGRAVRVRGHPGWTGHVDTSYDAIPEYTQTSARDSTHSYTGKDQILYWSDATTEIAFVVPSDSDHAELEKQDSMDGCCHSSRTDRQPGSCWDVSSSSSGAPSYERSISESEKHDKKIGTRTLSLELEKQYSTTSSTGSGRRNKDYTTKILIVWLEDYEDHLNLPIDDLLTYCETGVSWRRREVCTICVSALRGGLIRVRGGLNGMCNRDDAVVSPLVLPDMLRTAILTRTAAGRLHTDLYQPPHVRRRHLIQELAQQYKKDLTDPELLESLFRPP